MFVFIFVGGGNVCFCICSKAVMFVSVFVGGGNVCFCICRRW